MKEYRLARGWRIASYVFCLAFLVLSGALGYFGVTSYPDLVSVFFYSGGMLLLLFLTWYMYMDTRFGKLVIEESTVSLRGPFGVTTLPYEAVKGYRPIENYLVLVPSGKTFRQIKISTYLEEIREIQEWAVSNFPDVRELEREEEEKEIMADQELGITEESRYKRLAEARKVARYFNWFAWAITAWVLFYPRPYAVAIIAGIATPLIALALCYLYRGMMKGGDRENSAYPSVAEAFILPGLAIMLRALFDYNILDYSKAWLPMGVMTAGLFLLYQLPTGGFSPKKTSDYIFLSLFPLFTFIYSFGALLTLNCTFDKAEPDVYTSTVIDKRISGGKTTSYYLELEPWGDLGKPQEVKVSRALYENTVIDNRVEVYQFEGFLKIPWFDIGSPGADQ